MAECLPCSSGDQVRRLLQRQGACCVICGPHLTDGPSEWLFDDLPPSCLMLMVGPKHQLDLCGSPDIFKLPTPPAPGGDRPHRAAAHPVQPPDGALCPQQPQLCRAAGHQPGQAGPDGGKGASPKRRPTTGSRSGAWTRAAGWSRPPGRCWRSWRSRRPKDRASSGPNSGPELVLF